MTNKNDPTHKLGTSPKNADKEGCGCGQQEKSEAHECCGGHHGHQHGHHSHGGECGHRHAQGHEQKSGCCGGGRGLGKCGCS